MSLIQNKPNLLGTKPVIVLFVCLFGGTHRKVIRALFWLFAKGSLLVVLKESYIYSGKDQTRKALPKANT